MSFVISEGSIRTLDRPASQPAYRLRLTDDLTADYAAIWRSQHAVRTVVSFLGRNIAQLGLHVFRRVSDEDRVRIVDSPLAALLSRPNPRTTRYRMMDALVQDLAIYDAAYLLKLDGPALVRVPPRIIEPIGESWLWPEGFRIHGAKGRREVPADQVVYFRGYSPTGSTHGTPPMESLRQVLSEEWESGRMRRQILRNGARISGYLQRPADAPDWSDEARERFSRAWKAQYAGGGPEAGGTPILEDGMTFTPASQTAQQLQYVEARKLTREEVAATYHVPPPMVGILDNATFSNIESQHKSLYQDTLGPWVSMIAAELNLQLVPDFEQSDVYVEFNLAEKLRGSFEEQAQQLQASVGAPWLTRNEARARNNLPSVVGGDDLVVPLNVLVGGQASPRDAGTQNLRSGVPTVKALLETTPDALLVKARARREDEASATAVLKRFFARQRAATLARLGVGDDGWWDADRWDRELGDDLFVLAATVTDEIAADVLTELGFDPTVYDSGRVVDFLQAVAAARATAINTVTKSQIDAALADDLSDDAAKSTPEGVFDVAETTRAAAAGVTFATTLAGIATVEAVRATNRRGATKTWVVTSANPRPSHAQMHGATVPVFEAFANGAQWPGDVSALNVDEVAGCRCVVDITIPT